MLSFFGFIKRYESDNSRFGDAARYVTGLGALPEVADFGVCYNKIADDLRDLGAAQEIRKTVHDLYFGPYRDYLANMRRIREARDILDKALDLSGCTYNDGAIRSDYKRRPDLLLLAAIARGLFDVSDAIRDY